MAHGDTVTLKMELVMQSSQIKHKFIQNNLKTDVHKNKIKQRFD